MDQQLLGIEQQKGEPQIQGQGVQYPKQKTNHLGFPEDDDLFGIKDLKNLYKRQMNKKKKKKTKRVRPILTQGQKKKLRQFLKDGKQSSNIKYNIIKG